MNKEIILYNLEIIKQYLGINTEDFSIMFGKEKSYYRKVIRSDKKIPDLDFVVKVCKHCHIKIERFLNEKLKLQLVFESDEYKEIKGEDKE